MENSDEVINKAAEHIGLESFEKKKKPKKSQERRRAFKMFLTELHHLDQMMMPDERFTAVVEQFKRAIDAFAVYAYELEKFGEDDE